MGAHPDPAKCQMVVTVTAKGKTWHDDPQGEQNATVSISPSYGGKPYYFGYLDGWTNPFERHLTSTSLDGGVIFLDVPPR